MSNYINLNTTNLPKQKKVITFNKAAKKIEAIKKRNKTAIYTSGVFDVVHTGHIRYLRVAKTVADYLFVGLESDKSVENVRGENRPVNTMDERLEVITELESVDYAFALEDIIVDYVADDRIFEQRYKMLQPDFVGMPPNTKTDMNQKRQIKAAGAKVVIIDTPAVLFF